MMSIDDFTRLPEGSVVTLEGTIVRCPQCGRNGILKDPEDGRPCCIMQRPRPCSATVC